MVLLTPAIEVDKADVTDHVDAGLWDRSDPFGGFTVITPADLHALAEAAKARCAADRFDTALREACAHRDRRGLVPGSARNAARWLAEAAAQLRAVHRIHAELQSHSGQHGASGTCRSAHTVESLLERLTADYRSAARRPLVHQPARFKESA